MLLSIGSLEETNYHFICAGRGYVFDKSGGGVADFEISAFV